jgi:CRISPR-associated endonuclease/helicase Cas3
MGDDKMDYKVGHTSLFSMLSINRAFYAKYIQANGATQGNLFIRQAFKTAGAAFEVFDDDTTDIIVPYVDGRKIINDIYSAVEERQQSEKTEWDSLLEQVKLYAVSIYGYERKRLESEGALTSLLSGRLMILSDGFYDEDMGLYHELSTTGFAIV